MLKLYFDTDNEEPSVKMMPFQVAELSHVTDNPGWFFPFHSHTDLAEIIVVAGGRATYTVDGNAFSASAGDIFLLNPRVLHAVLSDPEDPVDSWTLTLTGLQFPNLPKNNLLPEGAYPHRSNQNDSRFLLHLLKRFVYECGSLKQEENHLLELSNQAKLVAACIISTARQTFITDTAAEELTPRASRHHELAMRIMSYVNHHYREPISNELLARQFHISVGHLGHLFTEEFGISPVNYQISRRMSDAQWMLIQTDKSVNRIAQEVGYENPYHFTNLFTRRIGLHPKEYRDKYRSISSGEGTD